MTTVERGIPLANVTLDCTISPGLRLHSLGAHTSKARETDHPTRAPLDIPSERCSVQFWECPKEQEGDPDPLSKPWKYIK
jgi:hypothetical protein